MEKFKQERLEAECMQDVLLLLENLSQHEETTIKIILDRLYDLGSFNLINQKISHRRLNNLTKSIARMSKPIFKILAWQWFKKNCPKLIADWLYLQITFENLNKQQQDIIYIKENIQLQLEQKTLHLENQQLRSQMKWLTGISLTAMIFLTSTIISLIYFPKPELSNHKQLVKTYLTNNFQELAENCQNN